jgi:hypothetical protein
MAEEKILELLDAAIVQLNSLGKQVEVGDYFEYKVGIRVFRVIVEGAKDQAHLLIAERDSLVEREEFLEKQIIDSRRCT